MVEAYENHTEKPKIIFGIDESESIFLSDSIAAEEFKKQLEQSFPSLEEKFDVIALGFGEKLEEYSGEFTQKESDYETFYTGLDDRFGGSNIAALVVAGDGNLNVGANPIYMDQAKQYINYTIVLGDTNQYSDLSIENIELNKVAFLGNKFPLKFDLVGKNTLLDPFDVEVKSEGKIVLQERITPSDKNFTQSLELALEAVSVGTQSITISINSLYKEKNTANNYRQLFIEVIDNKKRILITGKAPHPDIKAMRKVLESQENYTLDVTLGIASLDALKEYHLVIFMNLSKAQYPLVNALKKNGIPALYICGNSTSFEAFQKAELGITLNQANGQSNEVNALINENFPFFQLGEDMTSSARVWPRVINNFGNYRLTQAGQTLLYQKVGDVETEIPLFTFFQTKEYKWATFVGEGFFKWPIQEMLKETAPGFSPLFLKSVQYLLLQEDKRKFRLNAPQSVYENEEIKFEAFLYNASYEALLEEEIDLTLRDSLGKEYTYAFAPQLANYTLNAGQLPSGLYTYKAVAGNSGEAPLSGKFLVKPLNKEALITTSNVPFLEGLSEETGGKTFYPNEMDALVNELKNKEQFKSIIHTKLKFSSLINEAWIFVLIFISLSAEWAMRKYLGGI